MRSPLDITELSRSHQIEAVMTVCGRSAADPRKFRAWLESLPDEVLRVEYEAALDGRKEEAT